MVSTILNRLDILKVNRLIGQSVSALIGGIYACVYAYVYVYMRMRVYVYACVYICVYAYVKISTIYHQAKKRVDPPAGPQSKSLFDPSKKIKYIYKIIHF